MKKQDDFLIAHVDFSRVRFSNTLDLGVEFRNEIDAWDKMEAHFRHQIRNPRKRSLKSKQDLSSLVYSFVQKIDG